MFELRQDRVANFTSSIEFESQSDPITKNHIEFQWGSKLQGTGSEALIRCQSTRKTTVSSLLIID